MSEGFRAGDFNGQIYEEASAWFVEMRAGDVDAAGRQRFDAWVRKSPEHLRAYLEMSEIWDDASLLDKGRTGNSDELVTKAREGAEVVPFGRAPVSSGAMPETAVSINSTAMPGAAALANSSPVPQAARLPRAMGTGRRWAAAAAVGVLTCGLATLLAYQHFHQPEYSTAIGEQRSVTLADGTRVQLNSLTRLRVHFSDRRRDVELIDGQAMFTVARDSQRPFVVRSKDIAVRAVGTAFDVDRKGDTTTVTVVDGRVAVRSITDAKALEPVLVDAGEQVVATTRIQQPLHAAHANVAASTAWTHGELVFEGSRLADVIEEFNRHNQRQIELADPALGDMQISGVYGTTDPELFVRFMREQPHVRVDETPEKILIHASR